MFMAKAGMGRVGRMGEYVQRAWKEDDWIYAARQKAATSSVIPGVSNTTAAATAGGVAVAGAGLWALGKYFKWW